MDDYSDHGEGGREGVGKGERVGGGGGRGMLVHTVTLQSLLVAM